MRFLQLDETPARFRSWYWKFISATSLFILFGCHFSQAQTQAIRITMYTNTGNQALAGWSSSANQSFSWVGPGCLQSPSGPNELHFEGWASSTSPQNFDVDHVAGTAGGVRPDYTRFDSIAQGVYQLEMHFSSFFGDPFLLPKTASSCFPGSPGLFSSSDTIYSLSFKIRGDSVGAAFLNQRCGAIPDCKCSPSCIGNIPTSTFREPSIGGYYILQNLHTGTPVLLDSAGNRISANEITVEVLNPYDLQLSAHSLPDTQYYSRPILHARELPLSVLAENKGADYIRGIEIEASVYDEQNNRLYSATQTIDKLSPFNAGYSSRQAGETRLVSFDLPFLPKHAGLYRIEYTGSSISKDDHTANNQLIQYLEITDSTFARDNGQISGTYSLSGSSPSNNMGALGQVFELPQSDSLSSISVGLDLTNHSILQGFPFINVALYSWDDINQRPDTLVDTSFSYLLQLSDVGKVLTKTFSLSKGSQLLQSGKYIIAFQQYGAAYPVPLLYASQIYEAGSLWESSSYPAISSNWTAINGIQGSLHLRANFGRTYCASGASSSLGASIQQVLIEGASCTSNHISSSIGSAYSLFNEEAADMIPGNTYDIQVFLTDSGSGPFPDRTLALFVDWNEDFDFDDPGEAMGEYGPISGGMPAPINTLQLTVPDTASLGTKRLRLICVEGPLSGSISPCNSYNRGETEDHLIQIIPYLENEDGYCEASALQYDDLVITRVLIIGEQSNINLAINDPEVGSRYSDFTSQKVTLKRNSSYNLSVSIGDAQGNYQSLDKNRGFKVFIDWNQDGVFDPVNELADSDLRLNFNGPGPVNMTISVPSDAKSGNTRMRIIAQRTDDLNDISPCGFFDKGEVEDYTVNVPTEEVQFRSLTAINNPAYQITSVSLNGENLNINNLTSCPSTNPVPVYRNHRNNLTDIIKGNHYELEVMFDTCAFNTTLDSGKIFVYADWNKDGDLEDANESLYELPVINGVNPAFDVNGTVISIPFRVPLDAASGFLSFYVEVATVGNSGKVTQEVEEYSFIMLSAQDVGVSQIITSSSVCGGSQTPLSIEVCNWGRETVYSIPIEVYAGPFQYTINLTDSIQANSCITVAIDTFDTRSGAVWHISAQTFLSGDGDPSNNSRQVTVSFGEVPRLDADTIHFCSLDTAFLPAPSDGATYYWYDTIAGGTPLDTGTFFVPDSLNQPITYYVQGVSSSQDSMDNWYPDSTGYFAELGQQGNIADITAKTALSIEALDLNMYTKAGNDSVVTIYYKLGTSHGFERNPFSWQLLTTDTLTSNGLDNRTRLTLAEPLPVAAGQTIGLYIVGPLANAIFLPFLSKDFKQEESPDLIMESGLTNCSPAPMVGGCLFGVRYWSSVIHYSKGCESERLPITLTFDQLPPTPVCSSPTVVLDSNGIATLAVSDIDGGTTDNCELDTLIISRDSFSCVDVGISIVTLSATDDRNNTDTCHASVTLVDPFFPSASCQGTTLTLDATGSVTVAPSHIDTGSSDNCGIASITTFPATLGCSNIGLNSVILRVEDEAGNISACLAPVTVLEVLGPQALCQDIILPLDADGIAVLTPGQIDGGSSDNCGINAFSISRDTFRCNEQGPQSVMLKIQDAQGLTDSCMAVVTVSDIMAPAPLCQALTLTLDALGKATLSPAQLDAGSTDNCGIASYTVSQDSFDCSDVGLNLISLTLTDSSNNSQACQANVTIFDPFGPTAVCQAVSLSLGGDGTIVLNPGQIDGGSLDNCAITNFALSQDSFSCSDIGNATITLIAEDGSSNVDSCQAVVSIRDNSAPDVICNDIILILDANGDISLASSQIDAGSTDNCGIAQLTVSQSVFSCADLGVNTLKLQATDNEGNTSSCQSMVTVTDNAAPNAQCQALTLYLDASGATNLSSSTVDNGSNDNCAIDTFILDKSIFTCTDIGMQTVTLLVEDASENVNSCQAQVTVIDSLAPIMSCQNVTLSLNATGTASLSPQQVDGGTADICGISSLSISKTSCDCNDIGNTTVTLIATDNYSNTDSCQATVTVRDNLPPLAACQNLTVTLDSMGTAAISSSQIDAGSNDNCGISSISLSQTSFSCSDLGIQTLTLVVTDGSNNSQSCQATVNIKDLIAPTPICQAVTLYLDPTGIAGLASTQVDNGSNDNCGIDSIFLSQNMFSCTDLGNPSITLSVLDESNNQSNCTAGITVIDTFPPVVICQNTSMYLDNNGTASLSPSDIDDGSMDICGIQDFTLTQTSFSCNDIGVSMVTLTASDSSGNSAACQSNILLQDTTAPAVFCNNVSVWLDAMGNASLTSSQIDAGSMDNCGIDNLSISQSTFSCMDKGIQSISLLVTDIHGNSQSCQATVAVLDTIAPTAICQDLSLFLDATGNVNLTALQVDAGSNDNCQVDTSLLSKDSFSCTDLGINTVSLTTLDPSGNDATCQSLVTIIDSIAPVLICQNATLSLDANGMVSLSPQQVEATSLDNCSVDSLQVLPNSYSCLDIGRNGVILTAWDASGNSQSCGALVDVVDDLPPVMNCQASVTLVLNLSGLASLAISQVDNGSADNCMIDSLSLSKTVFDSLRSYNVYLRGVDIYGNTDSCLTVVAVQDTAAPTMVCQAVTVYLDGLGQGSLAPSDVDNGSSDRSGNLSLALDKTTFVCADLGTTQVTLTGTSINQQSAFCLANVSIRDSIAPTVNCQAVSLSLDSQGMAHLAVSQVHIGSNDNCGVNALTLSQDSFTCADIPIQFISLTAIDLGGNSSFCISPVSIRDLIPPQAICQDITLYLDASGSATLNTNQIDNGSNDNCAIGSIGLDKSLFSCTDIGVNMVSLTIIDVNNNSGNCQANVTIIDSIPPTILCQAITLYLDANGSASLQGTQLDGGSIDNCGIQSLSPDKNSFDCTDLGSNRAILTAIDSSGNSSQCQTSVIIQDTLPPTIVCNSTDIFLDASGTASLTASQVDGGSQDACGIAGLSISQSLYSCTDLGSQVVNLTATDSSGNSNQCMANVIVRDTVSPSMTCQPVTLTLDPNRQALLAVNQVNNGSMDNCGLSSLSLSKTSFSSADVGINSVSLIGLDGQNNSGLCIAQITVIDTIPPSVICQAATVALDASGTAIISPAHIDAGSSDIYPITSLTVSPSGFSCSDIGQNSVRLTVTNANGFSASCQTSATIIDTLAPDMSCLNVNVDLDNAGIGTLQSTQVDGGSIDNCAISTFSIDRDSFFCADVGQAISVTLTATDVNNNTANCIATITVRDLIPPTMSCNSVILPLDANGSATLSTTQVDNGSTDNCGISILALSRSNFTCVNTGINPVTLITIDVNGQSSTCQTNVFVQDLSPPSMICQDITVALDPSGIASIAASQVDGGTVDNCSIDSLSINRSSFSCLDLGPQQVRLEATDESGNSDDCLATVTIIDNIAPTASCQPLTVQLNVAGRTDITPQAIDNGSLDICGINSIMLDQDSFLCSHIGQNIITLTVTDVSNNTASCQSTVTVQDTTPPNMNCQAATVYLNNTGFATLSSFQVNVGSFDNCNIDTLYLSKQTFGIGDLGLNNISLSGIDASGNLDSCQSSITVLDTIPPSMLCQDINLFLDSNGQGQITANQIDGGSSDKLGMITLSLNKSQFTCSDIGVNVVTLTGTNTNNLSASCQATVTVVDAFAPTANCQNLSITLDASGNASLSVSQVDAGSNDNCGIASSSISQNQFSCADTGQQSVTLTVTDESGNTASCNATVSITDNQAPVAICQPTTLYLDQSGNAMLLNQDLDNGSNDNCGIQSLSLSQDSFSCSEIGQILVTLFVKDVSSNPASCQAIVDVRDSLPPLMSCKPTTLILNASGTANLSISQVDGGTTDNCGLDSLAISQDSFGIGDIGQNTVVLRGFDIYGNADSCTTIVNVQDSTAPTMVCRSLTLPLDINGMASLAVSDVDGGSSDIAGFTSLVVSQSSFSCSDLGPILVSLTGTNTRGISASCQAQVLVVDTIAPIVTCQNQTLSLDGSGMASLALSDINTGSSDNCGINTLSLSKDTFNCADVGQISISLTGKDASDNSSNCQAQISIQDTIRPSITCRNQILALNTNGLASLTAQDVDGGSSDNCSIQSLSINKNSFTCNDIGSNTVSLSITDPSGNSSSCLATVVVEDNQAPVMSCQNLTLTLDATGTATLVASQVDAGSTDNCGINSLNISRNAFTCGDIGTTTVILAATDVQGRNNSCQASITIQDIDPPVVVCQPTTLYLDNNGNTNLLASQLDGGSSDNCGIASILLSQATFTCSDVGQNQIILTARDGQNLSDSCQTLVTVLDTLSPIVQCNNVVLTLDSTGQANLAISQVNAGSSDNCGIDTLILSQSSFSITDLGSNNVSLTAIDINGNARSCIATVQVQALNLPIMMCQNTTVYLDQSGSVSIAISDIDAGSSDTQGLVSLQLNSTQFTCADLGLQTVSLTGTNIVGNSASCQSSVLVQDSITPVAICQSAVLNLNASGTAVLPASMIDGGSNDNCLVSSLTASPNTFDCSHIGQNNVILTAEDEAGNKATCIIQVQIHDPVAPVATCKAASIYLNSSGMVNLSANLIDNGSVDNCSITILALSKSNFTCSDEGQNIVTLIAIDGNGNSSTCQAIVSVLDTLAPIVQCQSDTLILDQNGLASLTTTQINAGVSDNCTIDSLRLSRQIFSRSQVGQNAVSLIAVDIFGNTDSCIAMITVRDTTGPSMQCQSVAVSLDVNGLVSLAPSEIDGGSSDQYGISSLTASPNLFSCANKGVNTVTLTAINNNGIAGSCQTTVLVQDMSAPVMICQNVNLPLDANGNATLQTSQIDGGSMDNCGIASSALSKTNFDCTNIGTNLVTFAATDSSSNFSSCQAIVTILDNQVPTVSCQSITVAIDGQGRADILPAQIDAGSSDNCSFSLALNDSSFDCSDIGQQFVGLIATDAGNNSAFCQAGVLIQDTTPPDLNCQQVALHLDAQGQGVLAPSDINAGSSDNCGITSLVLSADTFGCSDIGNRSVTLTAKDGQDNTSTCQTIVRVMDAQVPTMKCKSATVYLNANGQGTLTTADIDAGSSDNCNITTLLVGRSSFDCEDIGPQSVPLVAIDGSGNSDGCLAPVSVRDSLSPTARCQALTLTLDANGNASLTASQVDAGSDDNCALESLSLSQNTFTCADAGQQSVVLIARDSSNNTGTCRSMIFIQDTTAAPEIQVVGDTAFCEGGDVTLLASAGFLDYNWTTGSSDLSIKVTTSDTIRLSVSYAPGCWTPFSAPQIIQVDPAIPLPQIIQVGMDSLQCSIVDGDTYTWFRNDTLLAPQTRTIFTGQNGEYKVYVDRGLCSSDTSVIYLLNTDIEDDLFSQTLELYPNPNKGIFFLRGDIGTSSLVEIQVFSLEGKQVFEKQAFAPGGKLDELLSLRGVADGMYMLRLRVNDRFYHRKVEVLR